MNSLTGTTSSILPVIQLIVVIVTAIAGVLTARGLPTLDRQLSNHVALLKELPDDLHDEVKGLLAEELAEMATRARRRLHRPLWDTAARTTSFFMILLSLLLVILLLGDPSPTDPNAPLTVQLTGLVVAIALAISVIVVLGLLLWQTVDPLGQRRSQPRGPVRRV